MRDLHRPVHAVLATAAESRRRDELCHQAWGDRLTVAQFVEREARLRRTPFARVRLRTWLLVELSDARRRPLASLETYEVDSRHGPRPGRSFEIASVYTEPALRGRGHASRLLVEVHAALAAAPRAQAVVLYSDVGGPIYERAGYRARPAADWRFPALRERTAGVTRQAGAAAVERALGDAPPRGRYAILPTVAQIDWHRERERIYADVLGVPPVRHGVLRCKGGLALVAGDLKLGRLIVLSLRASSRDAARRLLSACADEAARVGLAEVLAWAAPEPKDDPHVGDEVLARGGRREARDGALPMLRPMPGAPGLVASAWSEIARAAWV